MPSDAQLLAFPDRPDDRLRRALRRLEAALEEQAAAVAGWRGSIAALGGAVGQLDRSLKGYTGALDRAGAEAVLAREAARQLDATADAMAARLH